MENLGCGPAGGTSSAEGQGSAGHSHRSLGQLCRVVLGHRGWRGEFAGSGGFAPHARDRCEVLVQGAGHTKWLAGHGRESAVAHRGFAPPGRALENLDIALEALRNAERVVVFCTHGKHRSFQLLLYLLSPYFPEFWANVNFVRMKRPVAEPTHLLRLWLRAVSTCLVLK